MDDPLQEVLPVRATELHPLAHPSPRHFAVQLDPASGTIGYPSKIALAAIRAQETNPRVIDSAVVATLVAQWLPTNVAKRGGAKPDILMAMRANGGSAMPGAVDQRCREGSHHQ